MEQSIVRDAVIALSFLSARGRKAERPFRFKLHLVVNRGEHNELEARQAVYVPFDDVWWW